MPRPSKRQKAAIDRENRKKARSSSLISIRVTEDVPDCIRNPSVEESGSVPDLQQPNSLAQISCREDDESSTGKLFECLQFLEHNFTYILLY
ncbi:hypothetical protein RP20_CCG010397 [Aedes albopictus]|nr:hypothetical protein RP20_CCG010397 [Aedes albopictus]